MSIRDFLELKELHAKPRRKKTPDMEFTSETKNPLPGT